MDSTPVNLLQQGIAAAKAGQLDVARALLIQVVEQDERNPIAWLWLSGVVDSLDDREVCLENVLTLDPRNQPARRGLDWLREQQATGPSVYTPPPLATSLASSVKPALTPAAAMFRRSSEPQLDTVPLPPIEAPPFNVRGAPPQEAREEIEARLAEFDDEYLCPYCAEPTEPEDKACAACHGQLWRYSRRLPEGSYWFWLLLGYLIVTATMRVYWMALSLSGSIGPLFATGQIKTLEQFVGLYLGLNALPPSVAASVMQYLPPVAFWSFAVTISIQLGLAVLMYLRWQPIYWLLVAAAVAVALLAFAQVMLNYSLASVLGLLGAIVPVLILLRISEDFMMDRERLLCAPDRQIHTHSAFYARGLEYARQGLRTLAVVHLRRAVAGAPTRVAYHLALAKAYAGLGRYERAESAWHEAQRLAPDNPGVREAANWIASARTQKLGAKRSTA